MNKALIQAQLAFQEKEVPVGCVFVDSSNNKIIAKGRNQTNKKKIGISHAELECIEQILESKIIEKSDFKKIIVYVTCEPCIMCASALRLLGVKKVYFGCANDHFGGCGSVLNINQNISIIHGFPYKAIGGILEKECIEILHQFYLFENENCDIEKRKKKNKVK
ncbi:tRNA-specific adenosine deaminase 2 [Anaeramoeba ignava]|uniref:tRNA-specific adenosine deaminase 2 n=1 Tax=Anaeramoeba ignava TaxID=1746090 RepID=A0A9Q0RDR9_ANAIG|nr:tRNA-specific adenosine deaminase 2 [Anaeramoeba ignava]